MKFLLVLAVANTVLFTVAKLTGIPIWKVIVAELLGYAIWIAWKAYRGSQSAFLMRVKDTRGGPGPLIWVVILLAAVAGGIWGVGVALLVAVATMGLFFMVGLAITKSLARKHGKRIQLIQTESHRKADTDMPPLTDEIRVTFDRMIGTGSRGPSSRGDGDRSRAVFTGAHLPDHLVPPPGHHLNAAVALEDMVKAIEATHDPSDKAAILVTRCFDNAVHCDAREWGGTSAKESAQESFSGSIDPLVLSELKSIAEEAVLLGYRAATPLDFSVLMGEKPNDSWKPELAALIARARCCASSNAQHNNEDGQAEYSRQNIENESADCGGDDDDPESIYYQAIDAYLKDRGIYYDLVLPALCIDEFMGATIGVYEAGYYSGMSPKVVGALIADAANLYNTNQERALVHLENLERKIGERNKQEKKLAEVKSRGEMEPKNAVAELAADNLYQFMLAVRKRLRDDPAGPSLHGIDQAFRLTSPEYLQITTELFQTAIDLGKSPTEVSTYLILAFAAAHEESALAPNAGVIVYLRGVIDYLRSSD